MTMATKKKISSKKSEAAATSRTLVMEKSYPYIPSISVSYIIVLGCGGTGSYVIPGLTRLLSTIKQPISLLLIDGDSVEDKNLVRQNFCAADVGRNKAEVMAGRYSAAFALNIGFRDTYLESEKEIMGLITAAPPGAIMIISCVDNIKARLSLRNAIRGQTSRTVYWVDTGNEADTGQVVLSTRHPGWVTGSIRDGIFPIPDIFDLYPDLLDRAKEAKHVSELSCAELAESSPQFGFVNMNAATLALNFAFDLIQKNPIKVHASEFSIKNKFAHKPLNRSTIERWKDICSYYSRLNMETLLS